LAVSLVVALGLPPVAQASHTASDPPNEQAVLHYQAKFKVQRDEAIRHLRLQFKAHGIVSVAQDETGRDYAGVWFNNTDGKFRIGVPEGASSTGARSVVERLGIEADAEVVSVASQFSELDDNLKSLTSELRPLLRQRRIMLGIDTADNAASIGVSEAATEAERAEVEDSSRKATVDVNVREESAVLFEASPAACRFPYCVRPLRGGVKMFVSPSEYCTAGFYAQRWGVPFVMTAGHCARDGRSWSSKYASTGSDQRIGTRERWYYGGNGLGDAGLISASGSFWGSPVV